MRLLPTTSQKKTGFDLNACRTRLVWANAREVEPAYLKTTATSEYETVCWYIERGQVQIGTGADSVTAKHGEWLFLAARRDPQQFSPRSRIMSLRFDFRLRQGSSVFQRQRHYRIDGAQHPDLKEAAIMLIDATKPHATDGYLNFRRNHISLADNCRIEAAFYNWLGVYVSTMCRYETPGSPPIQQDERIERAIAEIDQHPMQERFSERELAAVCGLSVPQFLRLFKAAAGVAPYVYYDRQRFRMARHALLETRIQIKEIAFDLGFGSVAHFSNWFKKQSAKSPSEFRQQQSEKPVFHISESRS